MWRNRTRDSRRTRDGGAGGGASSPPPPPRGGRGLGKDPVVHSRRAVGMGNLWRRRNSMILIILKSEMDNLKNKLKHFCFSSYRAS